MSNFNKKQKIIMIVVLSIVVAAILYYVYAKDTDLITEENLEIQSTIKENETNDETSNAEETYSDTFIIVHISGAVNEEGIVELKANSRIADAIEKAGGLKENACIDEINLAYILEDGMKVHIPTKEEQEKNNKEEQENNTSKVQEQNYISKSSGTNTESSTNKTDTQNTKVNINTATQTELETLPGIGPSTALKIIAYRNENGKFKTIEEIKEVSRNRR